MASSTSAKLIAYLIVLFGFVMGFVYNNAVDTTVGIEAIPPNFQISSFHGLDKLTIDYSILQNAQFQQLQVFGELPVSVPPGGTSNLFQ